MSVLRELMVDTKSAWIEFPGIPGFEVELATMSRPEMIALRKRCVVSKMSRNRVVTETLDEEKFVSEFVKQCIKNWKGLKMRDLETLLLVDVPASEADTHVPFSVEDAEILVKNSGEFDTWINEAVFDIDNFRSIRD